jgi:hypothetical protein
MPYDSRAFADPRQSTDFFGVDPKKLAPRVRPKKAKKVYRNWSEAKDEG